ncbi:hypothetical protein ACNVD4_12335, partial [Rhizobium sp. BR5]
LGGYDIDQEEGAIRA